MPKKIYSEHSGQAVLDKMDKRLLKNLFLKRELIATKFYGEVRFVIKDGGIRDVKIITHLKTS